MLNAKCYVRRLDALIPSRNPKKRVVKYALIPHPAKDSATLPQVTNCYELAYCTAPTPTLSFPLVFLSNQISNSLCLHRLSELSKDTKNKAHSSCKLLCQSQHLLKKQKQTHKFILYYIIFCNIKRTKRLSRILPSHISYFPSHR